jgi:Tfp pilus assembly protein PilO
MSILQKALGEKADEFWMHVLVAVVVGVLAASMTTYIQQDRLAQTQKAQEESIKALESEQSSQRARLEGLRRQMSRLGVKINMLLQAQGIDPRGRPYSQISPDTTGQ